MAVALASAVGAGTTGGTNALSVTWTYVVSAGTNLLVAAMEFNTAGAGAAVISSVTYGGAALTALPAAAVTSTASSVNGRRCELWYRINPVIGSASMVATITGSSTGSIVGQAMGFSGVDTVTPFGTPSTAAGTLVTTLTPAAVLCGANDLVLSQCCTRGSTPGYPASTITTNTTLAGTNVWGGIATIADPASVSPTWTQSVSGEMSANATPILAAITIEKTPPRNRARFRASLW